MLLNDTDEYNGYSSIDTPSTFLKKEIYEAQNIKIWKQIISSNEFDNLESRDRLTTLVFKGIPNEIRSDVWHKFACCNMDLSEIQAQYTDLESQCPKQSDGYIMCDVNRTFDCNITNARAGHLIGPLTRILKSYAALDPDLGYTQGMNLVASFPLILCQNEFRSFSIFYSLMQNPDIHLRDIYVDGFKGFHELAKIWIYFFNQKFPWLKSKLEVNKTMSIDAIVLRFFISLTFALNIPTELKMIVFDRLCIYGRVSLISFHLSLIKIFSDELQSMDNGVAADFLLKLDQTSIFNDIPFIVKAWNDEWISTKEYNEVKNEVLDKS